MVQKLSIDPNIIDNKILDNLFFPENESLKKIDQGFQNLIEIKKMAWGDKKKPVIVLNDSVKDKLTNNIYKLKTLLNKKVSKGENYKKLSNMSNKIEIHLNYLLNSPEIIDKIDDNEFNRIEFKEFILKLYHKFSASYLDFVLVNSKINSGFNEIDQYLSEYLVETESNFKREYKLQKDINNFDDFKNEILNKLGINGSTKNDKIYLINPGILSKITKQKRLMEICTTIKSIALYFYKKIENYQNRPKIIVITDNANFSNDETFRGKEDVLRKKFLKRFEDIDRYINIDLVVINRWNKKDENEQRFIFSSNKVGYSLNIEIDFLAMGEKGTNEEDFKVLKDKFEELSVVKKGKIYEVLNPQYKTFILENIIKKANNNGDNRKNPAFREIFEKLNIR